MSKHQFSMRKYYTALAMQHPPRLSFAAAKMDFNHWQPLARQKLLELLGPFPEKVPLAAEQEEPVQCEGYTRIRVVFDSEEHMSVPCILLVPECASKKAPVPAILCSHGHGNFGKEPVAGIALTQRHLDDIRDMNYDYARQMAQAGFVTLVPDLRGFGERGQDIGMVPGHDACDMDYVKGTLLGISPLAGNIWDMMCCIDFLETLPYVDGTRIGMMGLSQGGTMTAFTTAVEPRIKAADIIGYVNPFLGFGFERGKFCGSQVVPGLYQWLDTHDIAGLIAPRPLLMEMGRNDKCFFFEDLYKGFERTREIYLEAGAQDRLYSDVHEGPHAFGGNKAFEFFKMWL